MFDGIRREREIRKAFKGLARQRVVAVLQPGNVWAVERAPGLRPGLVEAYGTCLMRGWIEILHDAIPTGDLDPDGHLPMDAIFNRHAPVYRITDSGWSAIHRSHPWVLATFVVASLSLAATIFALLPESGHVKTAVLGAAGASAGGPGRPNVSDTR